MDLHAPVYVAGHRGLVGSAIWRRLDAAGYTNLIGATSAELDLRDREQTFAFVREHRREFLRAQRLDGPVRHHDPRARARQAVGRGFRVVEHPHPVAVDPGEQVHGVALPAQLRPARRLLVFSSMITMALNVTDPLLAGQAGKAAFDAVGPLLLIGWAEVGPGLLRAIGGVDEGHMVVPAMPRCEELRVGSTVARIDEGEPEVGNSQLAPQSDSDRDISHQSPEGDLLARARYEDARHREMHQRPISAETLRKRLHVGAARSRTLVATVRSSGPD